VSKGKKKDTRDRSGRVRIRPAHVYRYQNDAHRRLKQGTYEREVVRADDERRFMVDVSVDTFWVMLEYLEGRAKAEDTKIHDKFIAAMRAANAKRKAIEGD
jgi:hypothetical protein